MNLDINEMTLLFVYFMGFIIVFGIVMSLTDNEYSVFGDKGFFDEWKSVECEDF